MSDNASWIAAVTAERKSTKRRETITFDPPDDIRLLLQAAQDATGADRTTLIIEALRTDLEKVVRRLIEDRKKAEAEFFRLAKKAEANPAVHYGPEAAESYVVEDKPPKRKTGSSS